ncbi:ArnT family glycosyltransferase [Micromonospora sp. NBC_01813]|uniref:ArnT family glycosyltransferase n=1 Tax=Micromonospora sp. NBC_01813 TaxID=2975988 RepID=UPI002DD968AD|nr:glycosyltransferase family 39 protein [Micromonospora sp. NBC_01813]WSA09399.1 glycosyltransferase family 39 protein [Micromonospora sp. NBC_01813]
MTSTLSAPGPAAPDPATRPPALDPDPPAPTARAPLRVRLVRGRSQDPAWVRPALLVLLAGTAGLYLWGLGASGWANAYYSAAAQAGSQNWTAFFFGSSDAGNSITVDKPPASLWLMALSVRIFGLNSWSILVPQALAGVASVGVLYTTVRRWYGPAAGLIAGLALAGTPVAVLMFRFNNPDALLVLLLVAAAYATVRAVETASTRWLLLAGTAIGFAFLTKMLQALLIVPVLALVYLIAAPTSLRRRLVQLVLGGLAIVGAAGWWIAIVELVPASYRPYVGGSQSNSILELTLGYNGLGRITGEQVGSVGGGMGGGWGQTGLTRLFDAENGGQIAWLLPAALVLLIAGLASTARAPRTDRARAGLLLWGGWLLVTAVVFSFMAGIYHAYYTVALAPAVGALIGIGGCLLWDRRRRFWAVAVLAATVALSTAWAWVLLGRSPDWHPWLRIMVAVVGTAATVALLFAGRMRTRFALLAAGAALVAVLAGPTGYALATAATTHTGSIPTAGPAVSGRFGGPGGAGGPGGRDGMGGPGAMGGPGGDGGPTGPGGDGGAGQPDGTDGPAGAGNPGGTAGPGGGGTGNRGGGGMGGLLDASTANEELVTALQADSDAYTWVAAAVGANNAAGYQLASEEPVMALGGFNGSDPSPTLTQFQRYVADGEIHYFIAGSLARSDSGSDDAQQIAEWVTASFTATDIGGVTVYDLTGS